jgi:hypothetical protein
MANSLKSAQYLIESRLLDAARGDAGAYFDLGLAFSTGTGGVDVDLIQAHKWFNPRRFVRRDEPRRNRRGPAPGARMARRNRPPSSSPPLRGLIPPPERHMAFQPVHFGLFGAPFLI